MKKNYRIKEVKNTGPYRPLFYPQCRVWLFWRNIGEDALFVNSISNRNDQFTVNDPYTFSVADAEAIITQYTSWKSTREGYERIVKEF